MVRATEAMQEELGGESGPRIVGRIMDLLAKLTQVVRKADKRHEQAGGGTRHWVRECFLPELEAAGLKIVSTDWRDQQGEMDKAREWVETGHLDGWHALAIRLCGHKDIDGTCYHPDNPTPECHEGICPLPIQQRLIDA